MTQSKSSPKLRLKTISQACNRAARAIPPVWPLASSVAVNPFLGQTGETLAKVGARLARIADAPVTMPRAWYAARIDDGRITDEDLASALEAAGPGPEDLGLAELKKAAHRHSVSSDPLPMTADLAMQASGIDWPGVFADRFGLWAAGYFDQGQALWAAPREPGAFAAWRAAATHDLTPEIVGLRGFARFVADAPETAAKASVRALGRLGLSEPALETYLHQVLLSLGGWAQVARYRLWQAELAGRSDETISDLLAIRLLWEEALHETEPGPDPGKMARRQGGPCRTAHGERR